MRLFAHLVFGISKYESTWMQVATHIVLHTTIYFVRAQISYKQLAIVKLTKSDAFDMHKYLLFELM